MIASRYGSARPAASRPQYDSFRASVIRSPATQDSKRKGPVPAAQRVAGVPQAGPWRRQVGLTMPKDGVASDARNGAYAARSVKTTVLESGVAIDAMSEPRSKRAKP